jgi:hypothetical protein
MCERTWRLLVAEPTDGAVSIAASLTLVAAFLSSVLAVLAQAPAIGEVTRLTGSAIVERAGAATRIPLKVRDAVYLRDRVTTLEESILLMLVGGKAVVTMRETTSLTSNEAPGVATLDVSAGSIKLAVLTVRLKPGDAIEVVTPNAVAAVRGTVLVVEVSRGPVCDGDPVGIASRFTVLHGNSDVAHRDETTGRATGPIVRLGTRDAITISRCAMLGTPSRIAERSAEALDARFRFSPTGSPPVRGPAQPPRPLPRMHP